MYDSHGCMYPRLVFSTHGWYVPELLASCLSIYKNYVFKLFQAFFLSVSFDKTVTNIYVLSITTRILLGSPHITRITTRFTTTITPHHANHHENQHNNHQSPRESPQQSPITTRITTTINTSGWLISPGSPHLIHSSYHRAPHLVPFITTYTFHQP